MKLISLAKHDIFRLIIQIPIIVKPLGINKYFFQKLNEKNEVARYKARLIAQGFSQKVVIDYEEVYLLVICVVLF